MKEIFLAAQKGDLKYIQAHIKHVDMLDENKKSLLHYAVLGSQLDVIDYLIQAGINTNLADKLGETAIFDAARKAKLTIAKKLIKAYASVNCANGYNETPLHLAASKGNFDLIKLFVEAGAKVDVKTFNNHKPIHSAILAGNKHIIDKLMELFKTPLTLVDDFGNTLLHYAAKTSSVEIVEYFLAKGLNPNTLNQDFESPLYFAAQLGTYDTNLALLRSGALIEIKDKRQQSAFDNAKFAENFEVLNLYKDYQISPNYMNLLIEQPYLLPILNRDALQVKQLMRQNIAQEYDKFNYLPIDYAKKYHLNQIVDILKGKL